MQLYGNGVTKNFLGILQHDLERTAKTLLRILVLLGVVALVGAGAFYYALTLGLSVLLGSFVVALAAGYGWGHFVNTYRYQASIREHWNRWMRYSISCATVRECYRKVHGKPANTSLWWASLVVAVLIIAHAILLILALNAAASLWQVLPIFILDACLLGFVAGIRLRERNWYREFLKSVNELLHEGTIGVWGVY